MWEEQCKDYTPDDFQPQCTWQLQHEPDIDVASKQRPQEPHAPNSLAPHEAHRAIACHQQRGQEVQTHIHHRWHKQLQCLLLDEWHERHRQSMMAEKSTYQHEQPHVEGIEHSARQSPMPHR